MTRKNTLLAMGISVAMMQLTGCEYTPSNSFNPLLADSGLTYGAPDFSEIRPEHYLPAFEAAISEQRDYIQSITENTEEPNFENTILAFEESDRTLDRVERVFFALTNADKTPEITETEKAVMPMLTDLANDIIFNR